MMASTILESRTPTAHEPQMPKKSDQEVVPVTPVQQKAKKRVRASPPSPIKDFTKLSRLYMDQILHCFVVDIEEMDDTSPTITAAIDNLPRDLRKGLLHKTPRLHFPVESLSHKTSASEGFCQYDMKISAELITSLYETLFNLVFFPPPAINPVVHETRFHMTIMGMRAVMSKDYQQVGWRGIDVYEGCIGCRCRSLLSHESFVYTLLVALSCQDRPDREFFDVLEKVYLIYPEFIEGYSGNDILVRIESAKREGLGLRKEMSEDGPEIEEYVGDEDAE